MNDEITRTVCQALFMLPDYDDPDWDTRPDDLKLDVQRAVDILESIAEHYFVPEGDINADTCIVCGYNIRNTWHKVA